MSCPFGKVHWEKSKKWCLDLTACVHIVHRFPPVGSGPAPVAVVDERHQGEERAVCLGFQHLIHLSIKPRPNLYEIFPDSKTWLTRFQCVNILPSNYVSAFLNFPKPSPISKSFSNCIFHKVYQFCQILLNSSWLVFLVFWILPFAFKICNVLFLGNFSQVDS